MTQKSIITLTDYKESSFNYPIDETLFRNSSNEELSMDKLFSNNLCLIDYQSITESNEKQEKEDFFIFENLQESVDKLTTEKYDFSSFFLKNESENKICDKNQNSDITLKEREEHKSRKHKIFQFKNAPIKPDVYSDSINKEPQPKEIETLKNLELIHTYPMKYLNKVFSIKKSYENKLNSQVYFKYENKLTNILGKKTERNINNSNFKKNTYVNKNKNKVKSIINHLIAQKRELNISKENNASTKESKTNYSLGRWSNEEHRKFIEALINYGKNWNSIKEHIETRDYFQIVHYTTRFLIRIKRAFKLKSDLSYESLNLFCKLGNETNFNRKSFEEFYFSKNNSNEIDDIRLNLKKLFIEFISNINSAKFKKFCRKYRKKISNEEKAFFINELLILNKNKNKIFQCFETELKAKFNDQNYDSFN